MLRNKLQQAVITFIVSQLASQEDLNELQKAFKALDINKNGVLTRDDLLVSYKELLNSYFVKKLFPILILMLLYLQKC